MFISKIFHNSSNKKEQETISEIKLYKSTKGIFKNKLFMKSEKSFKKKINLGIYIYKWFLKDGLLVLKIGKI